MAKKWSNELEKEIELETNYQIQHRWIGALNSPTGSSPVELLVVFLFLGMHRQVSGVTSGFGQFMPSSNRPRTPSPIISNCPLLSHGDIVTASMQSDMFKLCSQFFLSQPKMFAHFHPALLVLLHNNNNIYDNMSKLMT